MRYRHWLTTAFISSLLAVSAYLQQVESASADQPESPVSQGIGYPSVAAALKDLKVRSDVDISDQGGWTIISDRASGALWSFTPPTHPAHPAAVKRTVVEKDGSIFIEMGGFMSGEKNRMRQAHRRVSGIER